MPDLTTWDSEAFILRGDDTIQLRRRVRQLIEHLDTQSQPRLAELAFSVNSGLLDGGVRLGVVAGSAAELRSHLAAAAAHLDASPAESLHDSQGVYYFPSPLGPTGKLAVLFAGEGSQYLGMLADLPTHFPEVRDHFALCDRLSLSHGCWSEPISQTVCPPPGTDRAAAERELWRLHNAVGSVLMTNWAMYLLIQGLGVRADAFAGHSTGEISALAAAGCYPADEFLFSQLMSLGIVFKQLEEVGEVGDAVLLAVAAGAEKVRESVGDPDVFLAMDNCPHQTVLAGPPGIMEGVEGRLRSRGLICERLPFRRPYHTPKFEPLLGPIAAMFEALNIQPPRVPVYSCVTGRPFPDSPREVHDLAVRHWVSRVEWTSLVRTMYDDGVRIFVEAGPRGNVTAFVQDVLRRRPVAAVAANVAHRSGVAQLNHLAAQLAAHQVSLDLGFLVRHRRARPLTPNPSPARGEGSKTPLTPNPSPARGEGSKTPLTPNPSPARGEGSKTPLTPNPSPARGEGSKTPLTPNPSPARGEGSKTPLTPNPSPARGEGRIDPDVLNRYWAMMEHFVRAQQEVMEQFLGAPRPSIPPPLLGEVVHHVAGQELVARRVLDLADDLFALDHTLGGRHASALRPDHHGLPVMPMAFSLEMMAEAASVLAPGRVLIGADKLRLHRWIPFDDEPMTLEIRARRTTDHGTSRIAVALHAPGNPESPSVEGVILFDDSHPEPPPAEEFRLTNERPCAFTPDQLYEGERRLFHGPAFQSVCSTDRFGDEGIEGHLLTRAHSGLFRSIDDPGFLTDPLLIDSSTHVLGCWHLGQPDQTGRVVLPYELGSVRIFGPRPAIGTRVKCRVRVLDHSARRVSHRIDLIGEDGRPWVRMEPAEYWRFYLPPEFVNFFRFKERFLLGRPCPEGSPTGEVCLSLTPPPDLTEPTFRASVARVSLTPDEWQHFRRLRSSEADLTEFVFGRLVVKDVLRQLWRQRHGEDLCPADIEIVSDRDGRCEALHLRIGQLPSASLRWVGGSAVARAAW